MVLTHTPVLSIVVPTRNNGIELKDTLNSINNFCKEKIQLVIVDGGEESETRKILSSSIKDSAFQIIYLQDNAQGVFPAQNLGIRSCEGEWIMILNSGDMLKEAAHIILKKEYLDKFKDYRILVFSQTAYSDNNKEVYDFTPSAKSIWPHQSVLVRKNVYEEFGLYREDYIYGAEQYFFAKVRKKIPFIIIGMCLTQYKLGGISSKMSLKHSKEIFEVKRELGENFINSFYFAFITPNTRIILEKIFGLEKVIKLKKLIFRYYQS